MCKYEIQNFSFTPFSSTTLSATTQIIESHKYEINPNGKHRNDYQNISIENKSYNRLKNEKKTTGIDYFIFTILSIPLDPLRKMEKHV